jgi:hypothetical protein
MSGRSNFRAQRLRVLGRAAWVIVPLCIYMAIAQYVIERGIHPPLSPRYTLYAIPAAVSILRGSPHDYSAAMSIAAYFIGDPNGNTDEQIQQALKAHDLHDAGPWFVSGDDKGLIDLTYLSFVTFGPKIQGLLVTVLALIGLSIGLFILQFRRTKVAMVALISILCGLYTVLFTFDITDQSTTIAEPRFLGVICIISSLHLMLTIATGHRLKIGEVILSLLQSSLIIFVIHLRSAEIWQVFAITLGSLFVIVFRPQRWRRTAVVVLTLFSGVAGLGVYRHAVYNSHYFQNDISTRVLWHNLLLGLATDPWLAKEYGFSPLDDFSVTEAVRRHIITDGRQDIVAKLYPKDDYAVGNFKNFEWGAYEVEARALYFRVVRDAPWEVFKTYTVLAPKIVWQQIQVLSGRGDDVETVLPKEVLRIASVEFRRDHDLRLSILRPLPLIAIAVSIALMAFGTARICWTTACSLIALTIVSAIPAILATPVIQYSQLLLTLCLGLLYFVIVVVGARLTTTCYLRLTRQTYDATSIPDII